MDKRNVVIHFIRHAESTANKAGKTNPDEYMSEKWFDAVLTPNGINQAKELQNISIKPDLVYTSPFRRTFMTLYYSLALYNLNNLPIIIDNRIGEIQNGHPCNYNNYYNKIPIDNRPIETEEDLINRGKLWFRDMIKHVKKNSTIQNVFVYTHGMFIYTFLNDLSSTIDNNCTGFPKNTQICSINISKFI